MHRMHKAQVQHLLAQRLEDIFYLLNEQIESLLVHGHNHVQSEPIKSGLQEIQSLAQWSEDKLLLGSVPLLQQLSIPLLSASQVAREAVLHCFFKLQWRITGSAKRSLSKALRQEIEIALTSFSSTKTPTNFNASLLVMEPPKKTARAINSGYTQIQSLCCVQEFLTISEASVDQRILTQSDVPDSMLENLKRLMQVRLGIGSPSVTAEPIAPYMLSDIKQELLSDISRLCISSDWSLAFYINSTLAQRCRKLVFLSSFTNNAEQQKYLSLETTILTLHICAYTPNLKVLLHYIMQIMLDAAPVNEELSTAKDLTANCFFVEAQSNVVLGEPKAQEELNGYLQALEKIVKVQDFTEHPSLTCAENEIEITNLLLILSYKLTWVLQALGLQLMSIINHCLYQVLVRHWQLARPLPLGLSRLLHTNVHLIQKQKAKVSQQACWELIHDALSYWPENVEPAILVLITSGGGKLKSLPIACLSEYLSTSFSTLLAVEQSWFSDLTLFKQHNMQLQYELRLLEQGAAAFKLPPLESFSALLHDIYALLELEIGQVEVPVDLLWQAHQELLEMLDKSACWFPQVPKQALVLELTHWLKLADEHLASLVKSEFVSDKPMATRLQLTVFLRQIGSLLGRSVRVAVEQDSVPAELVEPLLSSLKELLRWMLLQTQADIEARYKQRKPLAINIYINIQMQSPDTCKIKIVDDSSTLVPNEKQFQRLNKTIGLAMQHFKSDVIAGQGRRMSYEMQITAESH